MKIRVMPFLSRKGNRVAKAAIEFPTQPDSPLAGFQLVGFTICDDAEKGLFVLFPSSLVKREESTKSYFFLRPSGEGQLDKLQDAILDVYESMVPDGSRFANGPRVVAPNATESTSGK